MGRELYDWDIEVHGVEPDVLERLLRRSGSVSLVGRSFGVYKVRPKGWTLAEIDVSIPRRDSKVGPGHTGIAVEGDPHLGVVEAARRRDLTVNAIGIDLQSGEWVDPWNGVADLEAGMLRAVDRDTFLEDPLRALRVVQFAARLEFAVDPGLIDLCREAALDELPSERVLAEWAKLLLQARRPSVGLKVARSAQIVQRVFPAAAGCGFAAVDRMAAHRDQAEPAGRQLGWMLAAWLHSASDPSATLDVLGLHRYLGFDTRKMVLAMLAHQHDAHSTAAELRWLSSRAEVAGVLALIAVRDEVDVRDAHRLADELGVLCEAPPRILLGRHLKALGVPPGPRMGEVLKAVYAQQLDGEVTTLDQAREAARAHLGSEYR